MESVKINKETMLVSESVGMNEAELHALGHKLADQGVKFLQTKDTPGVIAEWLQLNITQTELLFLATRQLLDSFDDAAKKSLRDCGKNCSCKKDKNKPTKEQLKGGKKLLKDLRKVKSAKDLAKVLSKIANSDGVAFKDGIIRIGDSPRFGETIINPQDGPNFGEGVPEGLIDFLKSIKDGLQSRREKAEAEEALKQEAGDAPEDVVCKDPSVEMETTPLPA
jgi:hypothetical protein